MIRSYSKDGGSFAQFALMYGRRKPLVAVVEDDSALREVLEWLLEASDYDVLSYESAEAFLDWRGTRPDCLVIDVRLPGLSGFELLEQVNIKGDRFPVIFMSAFDSSATRDAARAARAAFIRKPFDSATLIHAIEEAIESALSRL